MKNSIRNCFDTQKCVVLQIPTFMKGQKQIICPLTDILDLLRLFLAFSIVENSDIIKGNNSMHVGIIR